jgi:hypothetical protein
MNASATNGLTTIALQVTTRKRPIRHGLYIHSEKGLAVRARSVTALVRKAADQMPWLRDEHLPLLRQWAELEILRRCAFAGIVQHGLLSENQETREVSVKRLVHDHRQIAQTQLMFQRELGMTPLGRAQLSDPKQSEFDLVAAMAGAVEPIEPERPDSATADSKSDP